MIVKTESLTGAALDWAVGMAEGVNVRISSGGRVQIKIAPNGEFIGWMNYTPSSDWPQGGPLLDALMKTGKWEMVQWVNGEVALQNFNNECMPVDGESWADEMVIVNGPTVLIAVCRTRAMIKLGETIDIPEELL